MTETKINVNEKATQGKGCLATMKRATHTTRCGLSCTFFTATSTTIQEL